MNELLKFLKFTAITIMLVQLLLEPKVSARKRKKVNLKESENGFSLYERLLPQGCYGTKQIREIFTQRVGAITYKPITPEWCSDNEFLVPTRLKRKQYQTTTPPYYIRAEQQSNNVFRVVVKSQESNATIQDAILVARPVDNKGRVVSNNRGRFVQSPGVQLICCSLTDKDVARFTNKKMYVEEVVFYWSPYEEVTEDFEGNLIFIATIANSTNEYWINVTSKVMHVASSDSVLLVQCKL